MMESVYNYDELKGFGIVDYVSLILMLLICSAIGIYYGFFKGKVTVAEYTVGNRNMNVLPVALSMLASLVSSPLYIGKITESYLFGLDTIWVAMTGPITYVIYSVFILPTLFELQLPTLYEYLYLRFGSSIRIQTSIIFVIRQVFVCPIIIYVAAMCFSEVTGVKMDLVAIITSIICILYTSVGGLRAVVWTDVIQTVIMLLAVLLIAIVGTTSVGGFQTVWERNYNGSRMNPPKIEIDLSIRYTLWAVIFGSTATVLTQNGLNQAVFQRCLCLPTLKAARRACMIHFFGLSMTFVIIPYCGYVIYATFHDCDPITSLVVERKDQVVPYFILTSLKHVTGIRGIFVAGIFSAALSTLSTSLNNLACVLLQDIYKPFIRKTPSERECKIFIMATVIIFGSVLTLLTFLAEKIGTVYQLTISLSSIVNGPFLALFIVGLYVPSVGSKAAIAGFWSGFSFVLWIFIGAQLTVRGTGLKAKPLYTHGCEYNFTKVTHDIPDYHSEYSFPLYKVSFMWYGTIGFLVSLLITWILSFFIKSNTINQLDPKLFSPLVRNRILPAREEDTAVEMKLI